MEKIYGYKEKDIRGLAEFIKNKGTKSLSTVFEEYGNYSGKAKGTVRNLYYAIAKRSVEDREFCKDFFGGKPLTVSEIVGFEGEEERALIKKILTEREKGRSVRNIIMELSNGDGKLALRYQNKFRGAIKNKPHFIAEIVEELKGEGINVTEFSASEKVKGIIPDASFNRLKKEVDDLVNKIAAKTRKENEYLKERVIFLERENSRLINLIQGESAAEKFFKNRDRKEYIN